MSPCDKLCSGNPEMTNLRTDEIAFVRNLTKIGTDQNNAIYSKCVLIDNKKNRLCHILCIVYLDKCITKKTWSRSDVDHLQTGQEIYEAYNTARQPDILEVSLRGAVYRKLSFIHVFVFVIFTRRILSQTWNTTNMFVTCVLHIR